MSLSQNEVVDYIKNLKLAEVKALVETLENELGVKAGVAMSAAAPAGAGAAAAACPGTAGCAPPAGGSPAAARARAPRRYTSSGCAHALVQ